MPEMICNICGERVKVRKMSGYSKPFPVSHLAPDSINPCHGFFKTGHLVKEDE